MLENKLGKIQSIGIGYGGYDDAMIGISVSLGNDSWGVSDFKGTWASRASGASWTKAHQIKRWGETVEWLKNLLDEAKVTNINQLKNVPVEVVFEGNTLKSWRILTEVIK